MGIIKKANKGPIKKVFYLLTWFKKGNFINMLTEVNEKVMCMSYEFGDVSDRREE
jgi:hypothetical protein